MYIIYVSKVAEPARTSVFSRIMYYRSKGCTGSSRNRPISEKMPLAGARVRMWALLLLLACLPGSQESACPRYDLSADPLFLSTTAEDYDSTQTCFLDTSGNNRHGVLVAGTVSSGRAAGNGATNQISYVQGSSTARINWPGGSVPSSFTICSVTRYAGAARQRILQALQGNWLHGHHTGYAGSTHYEGTCIFLKENKDGRIIWAF